MAKNCHRCVWFSVNIIFVPAALGPATIQLVVKSARENFERGEPFDLLRVMNEFCKVDKG